MANDARLPHHVLQYEAALHGISHAFIMTYLLLWVSQLCSAAAEHSCSAHACKGQRPVNGPRVWDDHLLITGPEFVQGVAISEGAVSNQKDERSCTSISKSAASIRFDAPSFIAFLLQVMHGIAQESCFECQLSHKSRFLMDVARKDLLFTCPLGQDKTAVSSHAMRSMRYIRVELTSDCNHWASMLYATLTTVLHAHGLCYKHNEIVHLQQSVGVARDHGYCRGRSPSTS